jgi:hypothetical protein
MTNTLKPEEAQQAPLDDISMYLDEDPEAQPITREEYVDSDEEYESSNKIREGLKDPKIKLLLTVAGLMGVILLMFSGCDTSPKAAKVDAKDQQIAKLQEELKKANNVNEGDTASRQARDYAYAAKNAKGKGSGKNNPSTNKPVSPPAAYVSSLPNNRLDIRDTPEPVSMPLPRTIPSSPAAPSRNNAEIESLKKQLAELTQKLKEGKKVEPEQIAAAPGFLGEEQVNPNAAMNVVDDGTLATVAPYDGGIEQTALLSGSPPITVAAGTEATARIDMPIYQSANSRSRAILTLADNVKADGRTVIPRGARLLGYANFDGDIVNISIETAAINGSPVQLPGESQITVLKGNKEPLIAKAFNGGGGGFLKNFLPAILDGATAGVQQVISPNQSQIISGNNIIQSSSSSGRGLSSAGLAAFGGLSNGLSTGLKAQMQSSFTQSQQTQTTAKGIKAGTEVRLIFTSPTQMVVPGLVASANTTPG